jgi:hypothetical protein
VQDVRKGSQMQQTNSMFYMINYTDITIHNTELSYELLVIDT